MNNWHFKLLYDGECPFCLREVRWLQRRNRLGYLAFEDFSSPSFDPLPLGVTREELLGLSPHSDQNFTAMYCRVVLPVLGIAPNASCQRNSAHGSRSYYSRL
ncbi:MAG: DUF393 domain-containing protein [Verrucomicrobia bacterium]|nr:DUF393 domain-containing protein [Verrucomicrobiota bacterium]